MWDLASGKAVWAWVYYSGRFQAKSYLGMDVAGYFERAEVLIVTVVGPLDRIELEPRSRPETNRRGHCYSHRWSLDVEQPEMGRLVLKTERVKLRFTTTSRV